MSGRVSENLDNPASRDFAVVALLDHPSEFGPKPEEPSDPALDGQKLIASDLACLLAGSFGHLLQSKHRLDGGDVEAEVPGMTDKRQPPNILRSVEASSTFGSGRRGYEPDPLIIADRLDIDARAFGQGSDSDHQGLIL